jgi:RNA polymerase subunit RPABC4/transcription elongation factor Spt4
MSVTPQADYIYNRTQLSHCIGCGNKANPRDIYCSACGIECYDYKVTQGWQGSPIIRDVMRSETARNMVGAANKVGATINLSANLAQVKERSVFYPALIFALVAVGVGLILSFIVDLQIDAIMREWLDSIFGLRMVENVLDGSSFKLGTITIWLLTCMGGLSGSMRGTIETGYLDPGFSRPSVSMSASAPSGFSWLILIPVIALFIARCARNAYINSKHTDKEVRIVDGLLGAGMFTLINLILSILPTSLSNNINSVINMSGDFTRLNISIGPIVFNLVLFSLIASFVFASPGFTVLLELLGRKFKDVAVSCKIAFRYIGLMLLCGFILTITAALIFIIWLSSEFETDDMLIYIGYFILALPNLVIWLTSFLTGGSFSLIATGRGIPFEVSVDATVSAFGMDMAGVFDFQWFGLLLLVAGLWIAVTATYSLLRNNDSLIKIGAITIGVSAAAMWAISACASPPSRLTASGAALGIGSRGNESISMSISMGTASFINLLLYAVMMAVAMCIIYFAKRSPTFDSFLSKTATPPVACLVTAVATVITVLSVLSNVF